MPVWSANCLTRVKVPRRFVRHGRNQQRLGLLGAGAIAAIAVCVMGTVALAQTPKADAELLEALQPHNVRTPLRELEPAPERKADAGVRPHDACEPGACGLPVLDNAARF